MLLIQNMSKLVFPSMHSVLEYHLYTDANIIPWLVEILKNNFFNSNYSN